MSPPEPSWRDAAYLLDMLIAARRVREFTQDVTWDSFERSDLLQQAQKDIPALIAALEPLVPPDKD